ncbi:hypothetical protein AB0C00_32055, partial [Micromonospora carbonacea]
MGDGGRSLDRASLPHPDDAAGAVAGAPTRPRPAPVVTRPVVWSFFTQFDGTTPPTPTPTPTSSPAQG